jgi:hypothetical protein
MFNLNSFMFRISGRYMNLRVKNNPMSQKNGGTNLERKKT